MADASGRKVFTYTIGARDTERRGFFAKITETAIAADASIDDAVLAAMDTGNGAAILHDGDHDDHDHGTTTDLSFKIRPGNHVYVFKLETSGTYETEARFGAGNAPLVLLPPFLTKHDHPLDDFALLRVDSNGTIARFPHNRIPDDHQQLPTDCLACFTANSAKLRAFAKHWQGREDAVIRIPFVYNFWNIHPYFPIWEQLGPQKSGDIKMVTHGGIHPTSQVNYIELDP